ncbi:MAG: CPBP family intramembrane glutamic endopeptidase [Candidatus Thermoplasmatota archaeon]
MDFTAKKLTHLVALLGVLCTVSLFILYPLISVFFPTQIPPVYSPSLTPAQKLTMELSLLFTQFLFVFAGLVIVPLLWYTLVNRLSLKEILTRLQLRREGLSTALLWGFLTVIVAFALTIAIGLLYMFVTKIDPSTLSNIPDLQQLFSLPSLYLIVAIQPFCEELFFRGFLLEKLTKFRGAVFATIVTSVLFGISHLSYTYAYAAVVAIMLGILFSVVVLKTKNLYSAIFAHTLINITSLTLFVLGQSFWI